MAKLRLFGTTAVAALVAGQAALADVTPEEIWQTWKDASASYGQTLTTVSEVRSGDTLTIEGASFASTQEGAEASLDIDEIVLRDQGDGTVAITMSDTYQLEVTASDSEGGEAQDIMLDISHPGLELLVSGTMAETAYTVAAPEMKVSLAAVDGVPAADLGTEVSFTVSGIAGNYAAAGTDSRTVESNVTADTLDIVTNVKDPESGGSFNLKATMAALSSITSTTLPKDMDMADLPAALKLGFATKGGLTYGQTDFSFDFVDGEDTGNGTGSMTGGDFSVLMNASNLEYSTSTKGLALVLAASTIPFPEVKMGFAETAFGFVMPIAKSDEPRDFSILTKLVDLTVSDEIWGMADPAGNLPRDPLTVILDAKGTATLDIDVMDEAAMEAAGDTPPGQINSLDLNEVRLKGVGAEVTGDGALTFDNTDTTTYAGMPKPLGTITMNASGINALIDKLTAMGLIPEDQLMGARMMLGMFAKPGEGEDTLTSVLEFKDEGFFANGMQLQ
jgi:hypothetical protein